MCSQSFLKGFSSFYKRNKPTIIPINVSNSQCLFVDNLLKIKSQTFPIKYLGIPLGGKQNSLSFLDNIIVKIQKKKSSMLGNILNFQRVGTHTLPQASLFSLPTYQFFVLKAPTTIYKNIEKIWRNFLWGSKIWIIQLLLTPLTLSTGI